ncbi:hypothetical protein Pcinc_008573 [Petrolisthes cinctipes]|uniref:Uncharacterized protein n=1 Tax=Petrolisthes cinctipes TaxID=88211 RepID=A0AAE1G6D4_PETCI|nr:hypothetical protein Pcinc_008573 [Petrolisthes cinctipes]
MDKLELAEGTPVPANNKRKRGEEQQSFKTDKCELSSILLEGNTSVTASIDKLVEVVVSKMAFRASIFMEMILESLLLSGEEEEEDDRWPDFSKDNMYDQIF